MNFCIEVICIGDDGTQQRWEGLAVSKDGTHHGDVGLNSCRGQRTCGKRTDEMRSSSRQQPILPSTATAPRVDGNISKQRAMAEHRTHELWSGPHA